MRFMQHVGVLVEAGEDVLGEVADGTGEQVCGRAAGGDVVESGGVVAAAGEAAGGGEENGPLALRGVGGVLARWPRGPACWSAIVGASRRPVRWHVLTIARPCCRGARGSERTCLCRHLC
jgi:hypothetical protein